MKLTALAVDVIRNCSEINNSLYFKAGNAISVLSPTRSVLGYFEVDVTFPCDFAIYDLSSFLGLQSLLGLSADYEFSTTHVTASLDNGISFKYVYTSPDMIAGKSPYKKLDFQEIATFEVPYTSLQQIFKSARMLQNEDVAIVGNGKQIAMSSVNAKNSSLHEFKLTFPIATPKFTMVTKVDNFKIIQKPTYTIGVSDKNFINVRDQKNLEDSKILYWIATSSN